MTPAPGEQPTYEELPLYPSKADTTKLSELGLVPDRVHSLGEALVDLQVDLEVSMAA